jgi:hypothetical protein
MGQRQKQHLGRSSGDESEVSGRDAPDAGLEGRVGELRDARGGRRPDVRHGEPNAETEGLPRERREGDEER